MPDDPNRPLKVFLCHAHADRGIVRELYQRLKGERWIDPWLDAAKLLPGQHWTTVIRQSLADADSVIILISSNSIDREGFVQREMNYAWDISLEKPRSVIYLIPLRLEDCEVPFELKERQWADYFGEVKEETYHALLQSLKIRHEQKLRLEAEEHARQEKQKQEREATEKARLEAEELERQRIAREQEALEKAHLEAEELAKQKAARERAEQDALEKARLETEELAKQEATREKVEKERTEKARLEAEELAKKKAEQKAVKEKKEKDAVEKARLDAEERERQRLAKEKAGRETAAKARLKTGELEKQKVTGVPAETHVPKAEPRKEDTKKSAEGLSETIWPLLLLGGLLILLFFLCSEIYRLGSNLIPPKATETAFIVTEASPTRAMTATLFFTLTETKTPVPSKTPSTTHYPTEITVNGVTMRLVPAGEFTMGSENYDHEKPIHTVYLDAFYMDIYEVTNALYKACEEAGGCTPPQDTSRYDDPKYENHPVVYVDWNQATAYCEWRGASLPTEAQWEKAARGTDGRTYPWGEGIDCDKANYYSCKGDTTPVGNYESGKSPYGIYDMAGNVWEWVNDWYDSEYYKSSPSANPLGPDSGQYRVLRGGSWGSADYDIPSADRFYYSPVNIRSFVGFRCARSLP